LNSIFDKKSLLLYAVTDKAWLDGRTLSHDVEEALMGGATMVQLREKELSVDDFLKEALEIGALLQIWRTLYCERQRFCRARL